MFLPFYPHASFYRSPACCHLVAQLVGVSSLFPVAASAEQEARLPTHHVPRDFVQYSPLH